MKSKFSKYWKSFPSVICLTAALDPSFNGASEAAFSVGGRVVSEKRASLSLSTIQALICLKDWKLADARQQDKEQDELRAKEKEIAKRARPEYMIALERPNANMDEVEQIAD
ncbi:hypothetical protein ACLB2K_062565 [Fragaria x ananassa]